ESLTSEPDARDLHFPALFVLDYYLDKKQITNIETITTEGGERFRDWLEKRLPSIPHCFLTWADYNGILKPQLSKSDMPRKLATKLAAILLNKHPKFWSKLQDYAREGVESWHTPGHNKGSAF